MIRRRGVDGDLTGSSLAGDDIVVVYGTFDNCDADALKLRCGFISSDQSGDFVPVLE